MYAHVGECDAGSIIIKLVNISDKPKTVLINLNNAEKLPAEGTVTILSAAQNGENSFKEPEKIVPVTEKITGVSQSFLYTTKADSVTILKLVTK